MHASFDRFPVRYARIAGIAYLAIILLGMFGEIAVRGTLVIAGNPAATLEAIAQAQPLWRAGIVGDLLMHVLDIPTIWIFYLLLKPVSHPLALLSTLFNMIQTAVLVLNKMTLLVPVLILGQAHHLGAFTTEQLQAISYLAINAHGYGFGFGLIFFGFACLVRGYLIIQSGFLPKALGVLLLIAGACYLVNSFALLLAPAFAQAIFPAVLVPAFVGELCLALWLLIKGVNLPQWYRRINEQAGHENLSR